jgi:hypothetical protein
MGRNAEGRLVEDRGCVLCRYIGLADDTPAQYHHCQTGSLRANEDGIPLCWFHHQGPQGIHGLGKKAFTRKYGVTEHDLLEYLRDNCYKAQTTSPDLS